MSKALLHFNMTTEGDHWKRVDRRTVWVLIIVGTLLFLAVAAFVLFFLFLTVFGIYSAGSPELARQWKNEMATWESPNDVENGGTVQIYEFTNGEWAIARSKDTHGGFWRGGGTVVIKDSRGQLHAFHEGHVCGDGYLLIPEEFDDLDSFYETLEESEFKKFAVNLH